MDSDKYQQGTRTTTIYPKDAAVQYTILGLANEAGEVAGKYKKFLRDGLTFDEMKEAVVAEVGDVLWYAARVLDELEVTMHDCMRANLAKLEDRRARGVLGGSGDTR